MIADPRLILSMDQREQEPRLGDEALCEIQFGHLRRRMTENTPAERAQFEVAAHKWIATANAAGARA